MDWKSTVQSHEIFKMPCDNHGRRHCLLTRASKLASNWFTWNAGGIFPALYICFLLD